MIAECEPRQHQPQEERQQVHMDQNIAVWEHQAPYENRSSAPIGSSFDGDTSPIGWRLFGYSKPPEKHQQPTAYDLASRSLSLSDTPGLVFFRFFKLPKKQTQNVFGFFVIFWWVSSSITKIVSFLCRCFEFFCFGGFRPFFQVFVLLLWGGYFRRFREVKLARTISLVIRGVLSWRFAGKWALLLQTGKQNPWLIVYAVICPFYCFGFWASAGFLLAGVFCFRSIFWVLGFKTERAFLFDIWILHENSVWTRGHLPGWNTFYFEIRSAEFSVFGHF